MPIHAPPCLWTPSPHGVPSPPSGPPGTGAVARMEGPRFQLDGLPTDVLAIVIGLLDEADALNIGMASRHCGAAAAPFREAALTRASFRWIVTVSGLEQAVSKTNALWKSLRPPLVGALMRQSRALHPALKPAARLALRKLTPPPSDDAVLRDKLDRIDRFERLDRSSDDGDDTAPGLSGGARRPRLPPFARIMALPLPARAGLLHRWLDVADGIALDSPRLSGWRAMLRSLPDPYRIDILTAVTATACDDDDGWADFLGFAWDNAMALMGNDASRPPSPACVRLLAALAHAIQTPSVHAEDVSPARTAMWDQLLAVAGRLAPTARISVLKELAAYLSLAAYARDEDRGLLARCGRLIDAAFHGLEPADTAALLCHIAADPYRDENECRSDRDPLVFSVMQRAAALPNDQFATVLATVLANTASYWEGQRFALIWDAVSVNAILLTEAGARARMLTALAAHIQWTVPPHEDDDGTAARRWSAIADKVEALSGQWRGEAVVALSASMCLAPPEPDPVARLLRIASHAPAIYSAELLARLIHHPNYCKNPEQWRDIMDRFDELPLDVRAITARKLALGLAYFSEDHTPRTHDGLPAPVTHDAPMSAWPRSAADARHKLSAIFAPLPQRDQARLLARFAAKLHRRPWHAPALEWLLDQTATLPPGGVHERLVVTRACAFAARQCPPEEFATVIGWLMSATSRLPGAYRGAALLYLSDLASRIGSPESLAGLDALFATVPPQDRGDWGAPRSGSRKRKEVPA